MPSGASPVIPSTTGTMHAATSRHLCFQPAKCDGGYSQPHGQQPWCWFGHCLDPVPLTHTETPAAAEVPCSPAFGFYILSCEGGHQSPASSQLSRSLCLLMSLTYTFFDRSCRFGSEFRCVDAASPSTGLNHAVLCPQSA